MALYFGLLLILPLSACNLWPFDDGRTEQAAASQKSTLFDQSPKACPTACAMASASKHELTLIFGSRGLPAKLEWGRPYVDGPGFKAFTTCVGDDVGESSRMAECLKTAHDACIEACVTEETARLTRKSTRHHARDEARKKARQKETVKPKAPTP